VEKTRLEIEAQSKAGLYLKTLTAWCRAIGESLDELTYEEQRTFLHVFEVRVTVYRSDHTPRYVLEWDASKLRSPYEGMILPRMTDQEIVEILGDYDRSNCSK
jgi:hypothetical protein